MDMNKGYKNQVAYNIANIKDTWKLPTKPCKSYKDIERHLKTEANRGLKGRILRLKLLNELVEDQNCVYSKFYLYFCCALPFKEMYG